VTLEKHSLLTQYKASVSPASPSLQLHEASSAHTVINNEASNTSVLQHVNHSQASSISQETPVSYLTQTHRSASFVSCHLSLLSDICMYAVVG